MLADVYSTFRVLGLPNPRPPVEAVEAQALRTVLSGCAKRERSERTRLEGLQKGVLLKIVLSLDGVATALKQSAGTELGARMAAAPAGPPGDLTERELDVLRLTALGHTNNEIASQLFLAPDHDLIGR